jgi:hypothetical protein
MNTDFAVTARMRIHGWRNAWNYFYKPQLIAWLRAWPATTKAILREVSFQIRLALLLWLLEHITKRLTKLTNGKA